jgi:hypothetical protein
MTSLINAKHASGCCPICESPSVVGFLKRLGGPVHQNLVINTPEAAKNINRGDISLFICRECGYIYNSAFDWSLLVYGEDYDSTQTISQAFESYEDKLIDYMVTAKEIANQRIVEIGSGKGTFLTKMVTHPRSENTGFGIDPSYEGPLSVYGGRLTFEKVYYDQDTYDVLNGDILVCRHVLEHLSDPIAFLGMIRKSLEKHPDTRIFFEVPCGRWILENEVNWDVFYEHCSYFTADALRTAFELSGFEVVSVGQLFEWPYLWLEAKVSYESIGSRPNPGNTYELALKFANSESIQRDEWVHTISRLNAQGKVAVWGAAAKGVTFVNAIDPDHKLIDCIIDLNPNKQGCFLPGTGHPIVNEYEAANRGVRNAILMNTKYFNENNERLNQAKIGIGLVRSPFKES